MARGKYSPTVTTAYMRDQTWHDRLCVGTEDHRLYGYSRYDVDGYDSYGYDKNGKDRAGNDENDYPLDDQDEDGNPLGYNSLYDRALDEWTFNGTRPVSRV